MKIVRRDSFDRKVNPDLLVGESIDKDYGEAVVRLLNGPDQYWTGQFVHVLVPDDYKLFVREGNKLYLKDYSNAELLLELAKRLI